MNQQNLPPQGRYFDPHLQQMVLDALGRQGVTAEKFYFTSDDWLVSPDHAWNSVFGVAAYRQNGQPMYAECGVSRPYDPSIGGWGEPAAAVKVGLSLAEAAYAAAPGALAAAPNPATGGVSAPATGRVPAASTGGVPAATGEQASSQTVLAGAIPGLPEPSASGDAQLPAVPQQDSAPGDEPAADNAGSDLRQAGDLGVDESAALIAADATPAAEQSASTDAPAEAEESIPDYESAGAEAEAREHPHPREANLAGYALTVREDGTAELQVPLGGQVTLKWAGQ